MVTADHHPVRLSRLGHGCAFREKFRVGCDPEIFHIMAFYDLLQMSCGSDRHGAFIHQNNPASVLSFGKNLGDILGRGIVKNKICGPVQIGGRGQTQEYGVGTFYDRFQIRRKKQVFADGFLDNAGQPRFIDILFNFFSLAARKGIDLVYIIVIRVHFMAVFRTHSSVYKPHISGSCNDYFHIVLFINSG